MDITINTEHKPAFVKQVCKAAPSGRSCFIYTLESELLPNTDIDNRFYRSVIQDAETQQILSVAPAKSLANDVFLNMYDGEEVCVSKIVEGTMINLFYSELVGGWEIATRNSIGGNYHYFRTHYEKDDVSAELTFKQMFFEAFDENHLDKLDKTVCYSFVLQHPSNHIVLTVDNPKVVLVSAYKLNECAVTYVDIRKITELEQYLQKQEDCLLLNTSQFDILKCQVENPVNLHTNIGIMITHMKSGLRTAIYNPRYLEIKTLRGNNPNLHYQYLVLRKINKVIDFLRYFPQYSKQFKAFQQHFESYVSKLHALYLSVRVFKTISINNVVDKCDKYHLEKLHYEVFIPMMKVFVENGKKGASPKLTRGCIKQYLDKENVIVPFYKP